MGVRTRARSTFRKVAFGGYTAVSLALIERELVKTREHELPSFRRYWRFRVARRLTTMMGARLHCGDPHGVLRALGEPGRSTRGRLVVANHRTGLDIGVLVGMFDGIFLSRADVAEWKVIGNLATHSQTIFVDRDDGGSGARAIREIRRRLKDGATVIVFPEGGTFRGDDVREFHAGTFAAARGLEVDVIPVGLAYDEGVEWFQQSFQDHLAVLTRRPRTDVCVEIGEPIPATKNTRGLAADAHAEVSRLVRSARKRHPSSFRI